MAEMRYGFVKFSEVHEAQTAIDALNGIDLSGVQLLVRFANNEPGQAQGHPSAAAPLNAPVKRDWASAGAGMADDAPQPSDNLYIKGLPPGMTDQWLQTIFGNYGIVTSTRVLEGRSASGQGESVALVRMGSIEDASRLVANLDGNIPQGLDRPVAVRFADPPGKRQMKQFASSKGAPPSHAMAQYHHPAQVWNTAPQAPPAALAPVAVMTSNFIPASGDNSNLYVKDLPPQADDLYLYRIFSPFGAIQSVKAVMTPEMTCMGYGFVKFGTDTDAEMALSMINGCPLSDGSVLKVAVKTEKRGGK